MPNGRGDVDDRVRAAHRDLVQQHGRSTDRGMNVVPAPAAILELRDRAIELHEFEIDPRTWDSEERLEQVQQWEGEPGPVSAIRRYVTASERIRQLEEQLELARELVGSGAAPTNATADLLLLLDPTLRPRVWEVDIIVDARGEAWASVAMGTREGTGCTGHRPWELRENVWVPSAQPTFLRFPNDELARVSWFWILDTGAWRLVDPEDLSD